MSEPCFRLAGLSKWAWVSVKGSAPRRQAAGLLKQLDGRQYNSLEANACSLSPVMDTVLDMSSNLPAEEAGRVSAALWYRAGGLSAMGLVY